MIVLAEILAIVVVGSLMVGPLVWRLRQDRRAQRAQVIRADTNAALFRSLGGESLVAVDVQPPSVWHPGRVVLSAPTDWTCLLEPAWTGVAAQVPAGYELVVKPLTPAPPPLLERAVPLRRAA
jgi:hypothetical protein